MWYDYQVLMLMGEYKCIVQNADLKFRTIQHSAEIVVRPRYHHSKIVFRNIKIKHNNLMEYFVHIVDRHKLQYKKRGMIQAAVAAEQSL